MNILRSQYKENPLSLSTAYWKVEKWEKNAKTLHIKGQDYCIANRQLLHFNHKVDHSVLDKLDGIDTDVKQNLEAFDEDVFFKLYHPMKNVEKTSHIYKIKKVTQFEYDQVVEFINHSYDHISVDKKYVESWTQHQVYDPNLWIWLIRGDEKIALGIAEYDKSIKEGALEWIQVKADYRGMGVGKILVLELLNRMKEANFVSVAGEVDNNSRPDKLYRSCGFIGHKIWYHYKRKRG